MIATRWFARLVLLASLVLMVQTVRLENAAFGLASPIWGHCQDVVVYARVEGAELPNRVVSPYPRVHDLAKSCSKLHFNLQRLFGVLSSTTAWQLSIGFLLCAASLGLLFSLRTQPPPNNSSKPTPLRGAA